MAPLILCFLICFFYARMTCCYPWHGTMTVTLNLDAARVGQSAPGSLSLWPNHRSGLASPILPVVESHPGAALSLLALKSRTSYIVNKIISLLCQDSVNTRSHLTCYGNNRFPGCPIFWVPLINAFIKFRQFGVSSDGRPSALDKFVAGPAVSRSGDLTFPYGVSRGIFRRRQTQKSSQLPNVLHFPVVSNASQQIAGNDPSDAGDARQMANAFFDLGILRTKTADLFCG